MRAPFSKPEEHTHILPLFTDPDNQLGYLQIYKCANSTYTNHFRNLGWKKSWVEGSEVSRQFAGRPTNQPNPDPKKILVIVRNPVERYVSALVGVSGSKFDLKKAQAAVETKDTLYTFNENHHFWPYTWFISPWEQFLDRMEFVDMRSSKDWLLANSLGLPAPQQQHLNVGPVIATKAVETFIFKDREMITRIHEYYANDYELLEERGLSYFVT